MYSVFYQLLHSILEMQFFWTDAFRNAEETPNWWKNDDEEGGKNMFEEQFLQANCNA